MQPALTKHHRRGLSLTEVVVSSFIVGVVLVGAMNVLGGAVRTNRVAATKLAGPALAQQLMTEVLGARFEDPDETPLFGHEPAEDQSPTQRPDFDDVDDYDDWSASPPETKDGTEIPGYTGWTRTVTVFNVDPALPSQTLPDASTTGGLKRITVTVTDPQGAVTTLAALRCRWGAVEQEPAVDTTVVTSLDAELQIGTVSDAALSGTYLKNHASDQ
ncbi:MAG: hypothetical protein GY778_07355 [bacterium]|nr:hypothetical protein [bacterium]